MKKIILLSSLFICFSCKKNEEIKSTSLNNETSINKEESKSENSENKTNNLNTVEDKIILEYKNFENDGELSEKFASYFLNEIKNNYKTLDYNFKKLQSDTQIRIATSNNKKVRFYSWDNNSGGTMRFYNQIVQFQDNDKTISYLKIATEDAQGFVSKIFEVQNKSNEYFYLVLTNSVFSTSLSYQSLDAYKIENNKLVSTAIFKAKKNKIASINFDFDFFSVVDRPERPVELITFNNETLKIPLIEKDGKVTSKHLIYKWNGNEFNYEGIN